MRIYWFRGCEWNASTNNFGDWLTPYFLDRLTGLKLEWVRPEEAEFFGCGSIIEMVPPGFTGTLLSTGCMHKTTRRPDLQKANVLSLRGAFTAEHIFEDPYPADKDNIPLGDLGLLCRLFAPKVEKTHELGIIPHYACQSEHEGHVIDIRSGVENVIREAATCERIISSSLHGVILADALGIENQWEPSERVYGKGFKFRDYASVFGEIIEPGVWRLADQETVEDIAERLEELVKGL